MSGLQAERLDVVFKREGKNQLGSQLFIDLKVFHVRFVREEDFH